MIKLHDKYFKPFISSQEIEAAIDRLVAEIANDVGDEIPVFVGILNGSLMLKIDFFKKNGFFSITAEFYFGGGYRLSAKR